MDISTMWTPVVAIALMALAAAWTAVSPQASARLHWLRFRVLSWAAWGGSAAAALLGPVPMPGQALLQTSTLGLWLALLVQGLGTVIGHFSARYLHGEAGQRGYVAALASVLAAVHLLLLADHWGVLIVAWALVGVALQPLLCFYPERPFARLAAHKKRLADRLADVLLLLAATLAWAEVGSGSLSELSTHLTQSAGNPAPLAPALQFSALALVLAVVLRSALLPVHGWLIQVMEAPTPVSALLHAGVVNLGGVVLIRCAALLEQAPLARGVLLVFGLGTAVLAGMVMLTRISIKVRLAWSTVAQMGFMLLECALGLYTLAALHLIGHSLYKAHTFLSASDVVRQTRIQALRVDAPPAAFALVVAPVLAMGVVMAVVEGLPPALSPWLPAMAHAPWPLWWSAVLALAWAPLAWQPAQAPSPTARVIVGLWGLLAISGLTSVALLAHALPLGLQDSPAHTLGVWALLGTAVLYGALSLLQARPRSLSHWRRWSYAGFYVDEAYTRLALRLWPTEWAPPTCRANDQRASTLQTDLPR